MGCGDAVGVQSVRDRGEALAGGSLVPDPLERVGGDRRRPAEPDALGAPDGQRVSCPL